MAEWEKNSENIFLDVPSWPFPSASHAYRITYGTPSGTPALSPAIAPSLPPTFSSRSAADSRVVDTGFFRASCTVESSALRRFDLYMLNIRNLSFPEPCLYVDSAIGARSLSDERSSRHMTMARATPLRYRCDNTLWILRSPNCDVCLAFLHNSRRARRLYFFVFVNICLRALRNYSFSLLPINKREAQNPRLSRLHHFLSIT